MSMSSSSASSAEVGDDASAVLRSATTSPSTADVIGAPLELVATRPRVDDDALLPDEWQTSLPPTLHARETDLTRAMLWLQSCATPEVTPGFCASLYEPMRVQQLGACGGHSRMCVQTWPL